VIYSVWNQGLRRYDYFESNQVQKVANVPVPKHIPTNESGVPVDLATWPLPADSIPNGSGTFPKGRIASRSRGAHVAPLEGFVMDSNTLCMIGLGVAAFFLWRSGFLRKT
jgi:hypothetical protein